MIELVCTKNKHFSTRMFCMTLAQMPKPLMVCMFGETQSALLFLVLLC